MYKRRAKLIIILLFIIMMVLIGYSVSKYKLLITENGTGIIAEPIIVFEKDDKINTEFNKKLGILEYNFKIKNYNEEKVNEVDFLYNIEILENNLDFPVEYKLINLTTNEEIEIIDNKTKEFFIGKAEKEEDIYKLEVKWLDKNLDVYSDTLQIAIKANIIQVYN